MKPTLYLPLFLAAIVAVFLSACGETSAAAGTQDEPDTSGLFVFVKIPESIMPIERGEKYEDPLDIALKKAGVGEVTGGGSQLGEPDKDGSPTIDWVGIDVDLTDQAAGLPLLKAELKRLGVPQGTTLEYELNGKETTDAL